MPGPTSSSAVEPTLLLLKRTLQLSTRVPAKISVALGVVSLHLQRGLNG